MKLDPTVVLLATPNIFRPNVAADPPSNPTIRRIFTNLLTPKCVVPTTNEVTETLFSFTVGNDIEATSKKSALEICWEACERVQVLTRNIDALTKAGIPCAEQIYERSQRLRVFLIRLAGIKGGDVAASKAMRPFDLLAPGNDYLIQSFKDIKPSNDLMTLSPFDGSYLETKQPRTTDQPWCGFSHCIECGTEFVGKNDVPTILESPFCGRTKEKDCRRAWLAKQTPVRALLQPEALPHQLTVEDHDWTERQKSHLTAAQKRNWAKHEWVDKLWCKTCEAWVEQAVVDDRGIAREHECKPANAVKRFHRLRRWFCYQAAKGNHAARQIKYTGNDHAKHFQPPGYGKSIETSSHVLMSPQEKRIFGVGAGERVNTAGGIGDDENNESIDRSSKDRRGDLSYFAKRPERYVARTLTMCVRPVCGKRFMAREGQKYCSKNCCNRHNEELTLIKENTCQQASLLEHRVSK